MQSIAFSDLGFFSRLKDFIGSFFFKPASARPLAILRLGLSIVLLLQAFLMHRSFLNIFGNAGFVQREVSSKLNDPLAPSLNWLIDLFLNFGISENIALISIGFLYVTSLIFLFGGYFTHISAFFAWLLHWSFINTGYSGSYGADMYAHFFLFYLIFIPSTDLGKLSFEARLSLRVLQLHMCISYLLSGLEKASGEQWWNGEILWRALNTPGYSLIDFHWLAQVPFLPMVGGWIVLAIEILYCIMVWPRKTRFFWVFATCLMHIGIAIFLRLHIFGILMCIPTIALFAMPCEPNSKA